MVVVEHRRKQESSVANNTFFRRHSASADTRCREWSTLKLEPAVDFPVQLNFGSPYSSSVTIFFDQEEPEKLCDILLNKKNSPNLFHDRKLLSSKSFPGRKFL